MAGKIIGIDLGTTNSVVAVMEGGQPKVIENPEGMRTTPSVVAFTDSGERVVGMPAKRQAITNPRRTVYSIKRFMGRRHNEVMNEEKMVPYEVTGGANELVRVRIDGKDYTPPEISAMILAYMKRYAEDYLGHEVKEAVITVPAYFNDSQRQATKDAGTIAGLEVKRILNEPTAASLAYGLQKKKNEKIAVFDLGGGTFDVSILEIGEEGVFEVKSTNGDTHLGGDDFDKVLIDHVASDFKKQYRVDLREDQMALQRLKEACERAKIELSNQQQVDVNLPFITADQSGPKHLQMKVTRAQLEQMTRTLVERCRKPCEQALRDANLKPEEIDEVVLVGGMTRMPAVQALAKELFKKDPHKGVNPDEVVAVGAAIQGGILAGEEGLGDILLLDVTPLSLGIETLGGVMTKLIDRNTTIPTRKTEVFSTASDNQTQVDIHVLQGEREMASDNRTLGRFQLTGIPPAPRGMPQVEVTFDIDANGILNVGAKDLGTGKTQSIVIKQSSGLSEADIHKMKKDAELHAADDKKKRELIEARNRAEHFMYEGQKTLKEHGDKIGAPEKKKIEDALEEVKRVKDGDDLAAIQKAMESAQEAMHAIAKVLYEQSAKAQGGPEGPGGPGFGAGGPPPGPGAGEAPKGQKGGDDVIDAEFEVKE